MDPIGSASPGRDGRDEARRHCAALFDVRENYKQLDIMESDGAALIARRDNPGTPGIGDGWQMIARQGKPGRRGDKGEPGPRGAKGDKGDPGATIACTLIASAIASLNFWPMEAQGRS
jgi:hypothetical protein